MSEKKLPVIVVLQRTKDIKKKHGMKKPKFFGELTQEIKDELMKKFEHILEFYDDVFAENELIPAVGKITVKPEAIAKSHKPNNFCKYCKIIGSEELNEIYIKVDRVSINKTVELIRSPSAVEFCANLTAILDIQPIIEEDKISTELSTIFQQGKFETIKNKIKVKLFDFADPSDNYKITQYINKKLSEFGFAGKYKTISYGEDIKFIKIEVSSYEDVVKIASINGVKKIDFLQEYSLPINNSLNTSLHSLMDGEYSDSDVIIGIIDGGISDVNKLLASSIVDREIYVDGHYQNPSHATFIASTIQYGNQLNDIITTNALKFKFVDIIAIPNGDPQFGPIDTLSEEALMEIIEAVMEKYASHVKIWNLSLGIESKICNGHMSDLGFFMDYIQDKYQVQIFVSSGNFNEQPFRNWPVQEGIGERDRLISPADSVRAISVGSLAYYDSANSIVKKNEPSPFSRRGPGANYIVKPELVDYGGNIASDFTINGLGMKGLDINGNVIEDIGTSYSTPRVVQKFASIYDEMHDKDILLTKAILIHSARMESRDLLDKDINNIKYYGFGMPPVDTQDILLCSEQEVTLVFNQTIKQGTNLEMLDFPYPSSLIRDGKYFGEVAMTLVYDPILDERYGSEYCRTNIDVSFGTYMNQPDGKLDYKGEIPMEKKWDKKFEKSQIENGFKWNPIKSYYRKLRHGIAEKDGWKILIGMTPRDGIYDHEQKFVLIITIKADGEQDIYSEVITGLRNQGYSTNNLETRQQIRQRQ